MSQHKMANTRCLENSTVNSNVICNRAIFDTVPILCGLYKYAHEIRSLEPLPLLHQPARMCLSVGLGRNCVISGAFCGL